MIILDSNILMGTSLRSPEAELLRAIRATGTARVAAPWIVLEELAARQAISYQQKYDDVASAVDKLNRATPWSQVHPPRQADPERVRGHWKQRYAELVETLPTSPTIYEQAMWREANLLAPCKTVNSGKDKTGARDAAIWLTAVEYAREHPEETVYFVSNNTKDFGNGETFVHPMDEDIKGIEDRFVLFTSLDGVLTKFATESSIPEEDLTGLLTTTQNQRSIADAALRKKRFRGTTVEPVPAQLQQVPIRSFVGQPAVTVREVSDVRTHDIGGHVWSTATARWLLSGAARTVGPLGIGVDWVNCSWVTRVLVSPTAPGDGLNVLRDEGLSPIASEDLDYLPASRPNPFRGDMTRGPFLDDVLGPDATPVEREVARLARQEFVRTLAASEPLSGRDNRWRRFRQAMQDGFLIEPEDD